MKGNAFFEDMAKMATGATSTMMEMRKEMEVMFHSQLERFAANAHLVTREEFDAVKELAANAAAENAELKKRIAALEKAAKPTKKSTAKKK